jgi:hypothetical protein
MDSKKEELIAISGIERKTADDLFGKSGLCAMVNSEMMTWAHKAA